MRPARDKLPMGSADTSLQSGSDQSEHHPWAEMVRGVLESVDFPMYIIDGRSLRIVFANAATHEGRLPNGATCYALTHHRNTPCEGAGSRCTIEDVKRTGKAAVLEHIHYDHDGVAKTFEIHAFPIFDDGGRLTHIVEYNVDVTERRRVEEEVRTHEQSLNVLVRELQRSNKELKEFTSIAAHDIRSPMATIASAAKLLEDSLTGPLTEDAQVALDILVRGVKRMTEVVGSLYRYSQVGAAELALTEVDLNRVVKELTEVELRNELDGSGGTILIPQPLHAVRGDESQIVELMQNLIANGLKYHRKGLAPTVIIGSREVDGDRIRIEASDNGIGIKEADRERIFRMFERLDQTHEHEGLGIGLAFCRRVVERHRGCIGVTSTVGEGSTFWVELPKYHPALPACVPVPSCSM